MKKEQAGHKTVTTLRKYHEIIKPGEEHKYKPYETKRMEGNALIGAGIDVLWNLVCGGGGTNYGSANGNVEVYIVNAWNAGTLVGGYPTYGSGGAAVWKSSWTGVSGDGVWSKWAVTNGAQHLNEKTEALGTKSGGTWTLEVSITIT